MDNSVSVIKEGNCLIMECSRIDYKTRMIEANRIPGLLPVEIREEDDSIKLYYDIASKETFNSVANSRTLQLDDIRNLVFSVNRTLKNLDDYLLDADDLIMDREYLYVSGDKLEPVFCYCSGSHGDFKTGFSALLQELLGLVDSSDRSAVVLAYGLYQASIRPSYCIEDLIKVINSNVEESKKDRERHDSESVKYKDDILEVVSVKVSCDPDKPAEKDIDELYTSLNADPHKYHFGNRSRKADEGREPKRKKGLGFFR